MPKLLNLCWLIIALFPFGPAAAHVIPLDNLPSHVWPHGAVLDQGNTPECVGYAWAGWGESAPGLGLIWPDGDTIYQAAKFVDGLPPNDDGTFIESAGLVLLDRGLVASVRYTDSITEAETFLSQRGPIVVASNWYSPPTVNNYLAPSRDTNGTHAYLCYGLIYTNGEPVLLCQNSWGEGFGERGQFRVLASTLANLPYHDFALPEKPGAGLTNHIPLQ